MENIIVTSKIVFNAGDIVCITKDCLYLKSPEKIKIIEPTKTASSYSTGQTKHYGVREMKLGTGLYEEIIEKIVENQKQLKYKILYEDLYRQVSLMPGGSEYLAAKNDFEDNQHKK